jgi:hypothetical protein
MPLPIKRPDFPLAATPEPMPVSTGLQPATQFGAMPTNKFQATADAAIRQISEMAAAKAASKAAQQTQENQTLKQQ